MPPIFLVYISAIIYLLFMPAPMWTQTVASKQVTRGNLCSGQDLDPEKPGDNEGSETRSQSCRRHFLFDAHRRKSWPAGVLDIEEVALCFNDRNLPY